MDISNNLNQKISPKFLIKGKIQQLGSKEKSKNLDQRKNPTDGIKELIQKFEFKGEIQQQQIGSQEKSNKLDQRKDSSNAAPDTMVVLPQELRRRWNGANQVDFHLLRSFCFLRVVCLFNSFIFGGRGPRSTFTF